MAHAGKLDKKKGPQSREWRNLFRQQFNKTKLCRFHPLGQCRYGQDCPYAHDSSELVDLPNLEKTTLCEDFQAGKCLRGEECPYAHGNDELRRSGLFNVPTSGGAKRGMEEGNQALQRGLVKGGSKGSCAPSADPGYSNLDRQVGLAMGMHRYATPQANQNQHGRGKNGNGKGANATRKNVRENVQQPSQPYYASGANAQPAGHNGHAFGSSRPCMHGEFLQPQAGGNAAVVSLEELLSIKDPSLSSMLGVPTGGMIAPLQPSMHAPGQSLDGRLFGVTSGQPQRPQPYEAIQAIAAAAASARLGAMTRMVDEGVGPLAGLQDGQLQGGPQASFPLRQGAAAAAAVPGAALGCPGRIEGYGTQVIERMAPQRHPDVAGKGLRGQVGRNNGAQGQYGREGNGRGLGAYSEPHNGLGVSANLGPSSALMAAAAAQQQQLQQQQAEAAQAAEVAAAAQAELDRRAQYASDARSGQSAPTATQSIPNSGSLQDRRNRLSNMAPSSIRTSRDTATTLTAPSIPGDDNIDLSPYRRMKAHFTDPQEPSTVVDVGQPDDVEHHQAASTPTLPVARNSRRASAGLKVETDKKGLEYSADGRTPSTTAPGPCSAESSQQRYLNEEYSRSPSRRPLPEDQDEPAYVSPTAIDFTEMKPDLSELHSPLRSDPGSPPAGPVYWGRTPSVASSPERTMPERASPVRGWARTPSSVGSPDISPRRKPKAAPSHFAIQHHLMNIFPRTPGDEDGEATFAPWAGSLLTKDGQPFPPHLEADESETRYPPRKGGRAGTSGGLAERMGTIDPYLEALHD